LAEGSSKAIHWDVDGVQNAGAIFHNNAVVIAQEADRYLPAG
jgi:hypothetical protein